MEALIFYPLAAVMLISSLMVILRKNPVHSALFLTLPFFCLAGIFFHFSVRLGLLSDASMLNSLDSSQRGSSFLILPRGSNTQHPRKSCDHCEIQNKRNK